MLPIVNQPPDQYVEGIELKKKINIVFSSHFLFLTEGKIERHILFRIYEPVNVEQNAAVKLHSNKKIAILHDFRCNHW